MYLGKSYSGSFTLSSAWETIRQRGEVSRLAKSYWHKHLLLKVSIFIWKLVHNAIQTDLAIQCKGVVIASKCVYCYDAFNSEFNNHLFICSDIAREVWSFFFSLLNFTHSFLPINRLLTFCCLRSKGSSLLSWLFRIAPCCVLWNI